MALQCMSTENGITRLHPTGLGGFNAGGAHNGRAATKTLGCQVGIDQPAVDPHRLRIGAAQKSGIASSFGRVASIA